MYLSKLLNVFFQIVKNISLNGSLEDAAAALECTTLISRPPAPSSASIDFRHIIILIPPNIIYTRWPSKINRGLISPNLQAFGNFTAYVKMNYNHIWKSWDVTLTFHSLYYPSRVSV